MKKPVHVAYTVSLPAVNVEIARQCRLISVEGEFRLETAPGWKHIALEWLHKSASSVLIHHTDQNIFLVLGCNFTDGKIETVQQVFPLDDLYNLMPQTLEQYESDFFKQQSLYKRAFEILTPKQLEEIKTAILADNTHYKNVGGTRYYSELDEKYVQLAADGSITQFWAVIESNPTVVFVSSRAELDKIGIQNRQQQEAVDEAIHYRSAFTLAGAITPSGAVAVKDDEPQNGQAPE